MKGIAALTMRLAALKCLPCHSAKLTPAAEISTRRSKRSGSSITASVETKPPIELPTRAATWSSPRRSQKSWIRRP
jgi:nitrate reductase beta subunit